MTRIGKSRRQRCHTRGKLSPSSIQLPTNRLIHNDSTTHIILIIYCLSSSFTITKEEDEKPTGTATVDVKMGEDGATEFDPDKIFRHLCFYLDTPSSAERHGMEVKTKHKDQITSSCVQPFHFSIDTTPSCISLKCIAAFEIITTTGSRKSKTLSLRTVVGS